MLGFHDRQNRVKNEEVIVSVDAPPVLQWAVHAPDKLRTQPVSSSQSVTGAGIEVNALHRIVTLNRR